MLKASPRCAARLAEKQHHRLKVSRPTPAGSLDPAAHTQGKLNPLGSHFLLARAGRETCSQFRKIRKCDLTPEYCGGKSTYFTRAVILRIALTGAGTWGWRTGRRAQLPGRQSRLGEVLTAKGLLR